MTAQRFFTRRGGVSSGIYESLNTNFGSNDDRANVVENRRRVTAEINANALQTAYQVHSADAVFVSSPVDPPQCDGLVTTTPGLALGILTADCGPVLLWDGQAGVIGACHAGWRGAVGGVLEATIALMRSHGADAITATLGPTISLPSYEVGEAFRDHVLVQDPDAAPHFHASIPGWVGDGVHFDLPAYILMRLARSGVQAGWTGDCTYAQDDSYFSYRRSTHRDEPDYGRNISAICWPPA